MMSNCAPSPKVSVSHIVFSVIDDILNLHASHALDIVLQSLIYVEKEISSQDRRWFIIKIMSYKAIDNRIKGLVITFNDITKMKQREEDLLKMF